MILSAPGAADRSRAAARATCASFSRPPPSNGSERALFSPTATISASS